MLSNHLLVLKPVWEGFSLEEWTGSQQSFIIFIYLQKFLSQELIKQKDGWNYLHESFEIHFFKNLMCQNEARKLVHWRFFLGFDLLAWTNLLNLMSRRIFSLNFHDHWLFNCPNWSARLQAASNRTQVKLNYSDFEPWNEIQLVWEIA